MLKTTKIRSTLRANLLAVVVLLLALAGATSASARVGDRANLPYFNGGGWVSLTSASFAGKYAFTYRSGPYCVYVQYKHVARLGVDATWNRLTGNNCTSAPLAGSWSRPTDRPFNGIKFRLCQDKPNALDPCGSDVTIYT